MKCPHCGGEVPGISREEISAKTKKALAERKAKGVKLGSPNPHKGGEATRLYWERRNKNKSDPT
jgi:DNA invertase Pin-like site-specific DNA recombinase